MRRTNLFSLLTLAALIGVLAYHPVSRGETDRDDDAQPGEFSLAAHSAPDTLAADAALLAAVAIEGVPQDGAESVAEPLAEAGDSAAEDADSVAAEETTSAAVAEQDDQEELCRLLQSAAQRHSVPQDFFIRLIWKESRFNAGAVSPVGAQGIAQFMPQTARIRGLKNPFDREEALYASAAFLADLKGRFGSWGLAAAAYNGGPNRIPPFVRGEAGLPYETIDYVYSITGRSAQYFAHRAKAKTPTTWDDASLPSGPPVAVGDSGQHLPDDGSRPVLSRAAQARIPRPRPHFQPLHADCPKLIVALGRARDVAPPAAGGGGGAGWTPWGAQVAGHPKRAVAMKMYARVKPRLPRDLVAKGPVVVVRRFAARGRRSIHAVQFAAGNRSEAEALCKRISRGLAPCVVVRNS